MILTRALTLQSVANGFRGFTPLSLSPDLWIDATQQTGLTDGQSVSPTDYSGNARNMTGSFTWRDSAHGVGGRPMFTLDGTNSSFSPAFAPMPALHGACFFVYRNTTLDTQKALASTYPQGGQTFFLYSDANSGTNYKYFDGNFVTAAIGDYQNEWQCQGIVLNGGTAEFYRNGVATQSFTPAGTGMASNKVYIGATSNGPEYQGAFCEALFLNFTPNASQLNALHSYWAGKYGMRQIICLGNSLTLGIGSNTGDEIDSYPAFLRTYSKSWASVRNQGIGGQTTAQIISGFTTQFTANVSPVIPRTIGVVWEGTNDLYFGATDVQAYNNLVTLCGMVRASGAKVAIVTLLPRSDSGTPGNFETYRQSVNAMVRANWTTFADYLADVGNDPNIGQAGDESNLTYYISGAVHLNSTGYAIVANYVGAQLWP